PELLQQATLRLVQMGLDGLDRQLHHLRHFLIFEPLFEAQPTASLHLRRQSSDGGAQPPALLIQEEVLERARTWVRRHHRIGAVGARSGRASRFQRLFVDIALAGPPPADLVAIDVRHDLEQPPPERRLASKAGYALKDTDEGFLGEIPALFRRETA